MIVGVHFADTVTLGTVVVAILLVIFSGIFGFRDRMGKRYKELYQLADVERKNLQARLDECTTALQQARETILKLDALQMPIQIVEFMNSSVEKIEAASKERLGMALHDLREARELQDRRDEQRHTAQMAILNELKGILSKINGRRPLQ